MPFETGGKMLLGSTKPSISMFLSKEKKPKKVIIPLPDWRLFRTDRIKMMKPKKGDDSLFLTFGEPPLYNTVGDKSMDRMMYNSKF